MTPKGKVLKLTCIAALFVGLGTVALGVAILVGNLIDSDACATAVEGLCSTVFGVRCSILANVPSNTDKIKTKALIFAIAALALGGVLLFVDLDVTMWQKIAAVVIAVIACTAMVVSSSIVKEQLRK